jgi:hypothetical protein
MRHIFWHGHPMHTTSWRCLDSYILKMLWFDIYAFARSSFLFDHGFCPIGFTGQDFGETILNASHFHLHIIFSWSRWIDFTYFQGSDAVTSHSRALYSFLLRPRLFLSHRIFVTWQGFDEATIRRIQHYQLSSYQNMQSSGGASRSMFLKTYACCTLFPSTRVIFIPLGFCYLARF